MQAVTFFPQRPYWVPLVCITNFSGTSLFYWYSAGFLSTCNFTVGQAGKIDSDTRVHPFFLNARPAGISPLNGCFFPSGALTSSCPTTSWIIGVEVSTEACQTSGYEDKGDSHPGQRALTCMWLAAQSHECGFEAFFVGVCALVGLG